MKKRKPLPLMEEFRALVKAKGFTAEGLRDLLNATYLSDDPISVGCCYTWMKGYSNPRAEKLDAIRLFVAARSKQRDSVKSNSNFKSKRNK